MQRDLVSRVIAARGERIYILARTWRALAKTQRSACAKSGIIYIVLLYQLYIDKQFVT